MELKDREFYRIERKQSQLEEQLRNLQKEMSSVRDWLQFNERLTRKLIGDVQRIKSDLTRETMGHGSSHICNHSLAMYHKRDRISSLRKEHQQSKLKLEEAQKEQTELQEKQRELKTKFFTASQGLHLLQSQQQSTKAALQQQELAINETLISRTQHQYYNIVVQDGKVEMKLTKQQVETLHMKIANENLKVKQLHEQLQFHQQKLQEVTRQNELLDRKGQAGAELEKHQRAYLESTLEADVMQCQIEISSTEFHKQQMEARIHLLRSHMQMLKRRQGQYEQIELQQKCSTRNNFKPRGGMPASVSHVLPSQRPRSSSESQRPLTQMPKLFPCEDSYYCEQVDSPSRTSTRVHHFHRNYSAHSAKRQPTPLPTNWEHRQIRSPLTHEKTFSRSTRTPRSSHDRCRRPHPPLQHFPSSFPYVSNPTYRSAEDAGPHDGGYVIHSLDEIGEIESGSNDDSVFNGMMNEPMKNYSSHEYNNFLQEAEYYDTGDYEDMDECYGETEFTQPSRHNMGHRLPSHPPKHSKNGYK